MFDDDQVNFINFIGFSLIIWYDLHIKFKNILIKSDLTLKNATNLIENENFNKVRT